MIIVITGASSGIGRGLTHHYVRNGHCVAAISRSQEKLLILESECIEFKGELVTFSASVCDNNEMKKAIEAIISVWDVPELVIACAGIGLQREEANVNPNLLQETLSTNLMGVANTFAHVIPAMMARKQGQLAAISSLAALYPLPRMSEYCCTKVGLNYFLESLHWTLKPYGIVTSTICPGFIDTPMTEKQFIPGIWRMELPKAVAKITRAIEQKKRISFFPIWLYFFLRLLRLAPDFIKYFVSHTVIDKLFPRQSKQST